MNDCFVYVSQVPRSGNAGQNKFEDGIIKSLLKKKKDEQNFQIKIFSVTLKENKPEDDRLVLIPLNKKNYAGFIFYQFRLLYILGRYFWSQRGKKIYLFIRYHPSMIAPLVLCLFFNIRLTMRTGPILTNLFFYNKNPGTIVFHTIKWVLGLFYKKAASIVTVTEKIKQWVLENYKLDSEKIIVVPNAADTTLFFPTPPNRKKWGLPENEYVFGFVGALFEGQGLATIIQALGILKKNREKVPWLLVVGEGEQRLPLESLSEETGISDKIVWAGNIPHEQVCSAVNACDMMLAPFQKKLLSFRGSSSLKLYEYLACDKPILASKFIDHQFLESRNLGRVVEPDNPELWAKAMYQEAEKNDFRLKGRGEKFVVEGHSYDLLAEKFIAISFGLKLP